MKRIIECLLAAIDTAPDEKKDQLALAIENFANKYPHSYHEAMRRTPGFAKLFAELEEDLCLYIEPYK